jgi:type II secretory pathway pseudopilin PulG
MELMVVVMLIAILAAMAAPSMSEARNDRICFDFARQYQQVLMRARSRAAGTGAAHIAILGRGSNNRGYVTIYQALDGVTTPGPGPVSSCKLANQWADSVNYPITKGSTTALFIDGADMNGVGVNETMGLRGDLLGSGVAGTVSVDGYFAICVTPSGITFVGAGDSAQHAIDAMRDSTPFTGTVEVDIQRHKGTLPIGILRRVIVTGGGPPRIKSE